MTKEEAQKELVRLSKQVDGLIEDRYDFLRVNMHLFADFQVGQLLMNTNTLQLGVVVCHSRTMYATDPQSFWKDGFTIDCCIEFVNRNGMRTCILDNTANYLVGASPWMDAYEFLEKTEYYYAI